MANDLGTPLPTQVLAVKLLAFHGEARRLRAAELSAKRDLVVQLIREQLPDWEFDVPKGGLFLWIRLPGGDSAELAQVAMRHRLVLLPGSMVPSWPVVKNTVQVNPYSLAMIRARAGSDSSLRYSWSPEM